MFFFLDQYKLVVQNYFSKRQPLACGPFLEQGYLDAVGGPAQAEGLPDIPGTPGSIKGMQIE